MSNVNAKEEGSEKKQALQGSGGAGDNHTSLPATFITHIQRGMSMLLR